jgi:ParB-like chromosome segregation protein Spo0J
MSQEKRKESEILERVTQATSQRTKVHLNELVIDPERFCHRKKEALTEANLKELMDSLVLEGLQVPIEYYVHGPGRKVLIKGHRRISACQILAGKNTPGFTADMELEAIEVQGASTEDLLIRSVADNEIRRNLDRVDRIKVARKLSAAGVQNERAAKALGISVKSYERDLLIATHPWMLQHVEDESVPPTAAYQLLLEAGNTHRLKELKEDLDIWVNDKKKLIREKEKLRKLKENKELRPAEKMVKNHLTGTLLQHWIDLLKAKKRFDEDATWHFPAGIEKESGQLHISTVKLDLNKAEPERIAKVASKLSQLAKELKPHIRRRYEQQRQQGAQVGGDELYDLDYLREMGLEDVAEEIEDQIEQQTQADGEEDPSRDNPNERQEADLADQVKLAASSMVEHAQTETAPKEDTQE